MASGKTYDQTVQSLSRTSVLDCGSSLSLFAKFQELASYKRFRDIFAFVSVLILFFILSNLRNLR